MKDSQAGKYLTACSRTKVARFKRLDLLEGGHKTDTSEGQFKAVTALTINKIFLL